MQAAASLRYTPSQFFEFLRRELKPHPGSAMTVTRIVLTVVLTFLLVATFRVPYAAIALYSVFTVTRSSPRAAMIGAMQSIAAVTVGVALALVGTVLFVDDPVLWFVFYVVELFVVVYLIRATRIPGPIMNMAMAIYSVHNVWERPYPAGPHLEQSLWVWLSLSMGFVVAVLVEFAFVRQDTVGDLHTELVRRLHAVAALLSNAADGPAQAAAAVRESLLPLALVGTSGLRERIASLREIEPARQQYFNGLSALTAMTARLVDVAAGSGLGTTEVSPEDRDRLRSLAAELERMQGFLRNREPITGGDYLPSYDRPAGVPVLPELERTAALMPQAATASGPGFEPVLVSPAPAWWNVFLEDAFRNPGYLPFALKGCLAATICYVLYSALDWPGIGTSVVTCLVTALTTVGATKQKQILRLAGATFGGLLAILSLVFVLPEVDSITGVTVLIAAVSALCAWMVVASPRLSYFGLQTCLAYYLTTLQDFSAPTSLAPARDRFFGVLLGLVVMWVVFDNVAPVRAADHMQKGLARNFRLLAELATALDREPDLPKAIEAIRSLRVRLQDGFMNVHNHAESVVFEFGSPDRAAHLALREAVLRWQASLRTIFVTELAICQYRTQIVPWSRPDEVRAAQREFDAAFSGEMAAIARQIDDLSVRIPLTGELRAAAERFAGVVEPWAETLTTADNGWIKTRAEGIVTLTRQAARLGNELIRDISAYVAGRGERA